LTPYGNIDFTDEKHTDPNWGWGWWNDEIGSVSIPNACGNWRSPKNKKFTPTGDHTAVV
jgi:hypothetical protein